MHIIETVNVLHIGVQDSHILEMGWSWVNYYFQANLEGLHQRSQLNDDLCARICRNALQKLYIDQTIIRSCLFGDILRGYPRYWTHWSYIPIQIIDTNAIL